MRRSERRLDWLVGVLVLGFVTLLVLYPMAVLLGRGIQFAALQNGYILERLGVTLLQASLSGGVVLLLSISLGTLLGRYQFWGKQLLEAWLGVPFVVPVMVAGLGFLALFGSRGALNLEGTVWLVVLANVFYNLGNGIRLTMNAPYQNELEMVARLEGAGSRQVWRMVTVPIALPSALLGAGLAFLYSFASFALPLLLGGSRFATLEVEMYLAVQRLELDLASLLAVVQAGLMLSVGVTLHWHAQKNSQASIGQAPPQAKGMARVWIGLAVAVLLVLTALPLLAVVWRSFNDASGLTLQHYSKLFADSSQVMNAIKNNLLFAVLSLLLAVPLGVGCGVLIWRYHIFGLISLLPLSVSSTVLGVGLIIVYPQLTAQLPLLIAVYALQSFGLIAQALLLGLQQLEPSLLEAAQLDGAGTWQQWHMVIFPLTQGFLRTGVGLGFAVVVGEFVATLMLSRPEWATLSTLIYQRLSRPNQLGEACALAVVLLLLTLLGLSAFNWRKGYS